MASPNNNIIKIHEHCRVTPPPSATQTASIPLTFFDLFWLRFHPVERVFYYTLPTPQSHPSFFFNQVVPKLKSSLSLTLQHFLPLAGNVVWPSESPKPIIQYTPGDGVSLLIAESETDFNHALDNSPHEASESRAFVPHLESTESFASVISLQITLFPNSGFSIGISTHHAVLDGRSSTMFLKAWSSLCKTSSGESQSQSPSLAPELQPLLNREVIKDPESLGIPFTENWTDIVTKIFPIDKANERTLKLLPFEPKLEDSVRATFELTREDLGKIKKRVLSMWGVSENRGGETESNGSVSVSKPQTLSSFVLTCAYVVVCLAKAIRGVEKERHKFNFAFTVDCRGRLEPPISPNYFGNCVWGHFLDTQPTDFVKEDGLFLVAKGIQDKIKMMNETGVFDGAKDGFSKIESFVKDGVEMMGVAGSNRFGVYETDFGWGRPVKVEIASVDRGLTIGLAESKDGSGGVEVGLVLNKNVMDLFTTLFREGLCID